MSPQPRPERGGWREALLPPVLAAALTAVIVLLLCWPLPLGLNQGYTASRFVCSQIWLFDHIHRLLSGDLPWSMTTDRLGFPLTWFLPINGWSAGLVAAALRIFTGPWGAYNATLALSPAAATLAAYALARAVTGAPRWTCAAGALLYGLAPTALGALVNSQIDKLQHWILPLGLLFARNLVRGPRLVGPALAWMALIIAGAFSGPDYVLHLSILVVPWLALEIVDIGAPHRPRLLRSALALGSAAAAAVLPWWYYDPGMHPEFLPAMSPAGPTELGVAEELCPVADPARILFGGGAGHDPFTAVHIVYLGLPALLLALALFRRAGRGRGRGFGALTLLAATTMALGPRLAHAGHYVTVAGLQFILPATLVELAQHPLVRSGMYYRFMVAAWLGLALLLAAGLAAPLRRPAWLRPGPLAWLVAALLFADTLRVTWPLWPRPLVPLSSFELDQRLAEDPVLGAVLELPLGRHLEVDEAWAMQSALVHGRATTGRITHTVELAHVEESASRWLDEAAHAPDPCGARAALARHGLRFAVWRPPGLDMEGEHQRLVNILGPGQVVGAGRYWTLETPGEPCAE